MTYLNTIEKFKILFNTLLDFKVILIFLGLTIFLTILYAIKKLSSKRYIECTIVSLIIALLFSILNNKKILSNTFDNFLTIFFRNIYFPSIYVYISILVIILLSTIVTLLNKKTKTTYKIINSTTFIINSLLFILILNIIAKNKIDIFSVSSLYTNTALVVTLEISTGLFLVWLSLLLIAYVTENIIERITNKKEEYIINKEENIFQDLNILEVFEPNTNIENNIKVPLIVNNVEPINYIEVKLSDDNISFQDILERISNLEKTEGNIDDIDIFTIDEEYTKTNKINVLS